VVGESEKVRLVESVRGWEREKMRERERERWYRVYLQTLALFSHHSLSLSLPTPAHSPTWPCLMTRIRRVLSLVHVCVYVYVYV
jgi:hypothetical protein